MHYSNELSSIYLDVKIRMLFFRYLLVLSITILLLPGCAGIDKDKPADSSAKKLYEQAHAAIAATEFQTAVKNLQSLEASYPFSPYAKQAQLDIAYAYYKFDELDKADSAANRFIRLHPRSAHLDYVYYLKGLVNFTRGAGLLDTWFPRKPYKHDPTVMENAYNDFATLVSRYPNSLYAGDAYQRMIYLRNQMAEKEISIAEFYLKRGAWLASAERAKAVIMRYSASIWVKRALEIMQISYKKLGLNKLAADTQRVIDSNNFSHYSSALITPKKPDKLPPSTL